MTSRDEIFMKRALELAKLGKGMVSPNPLVGCVIVHNGKIIGEGCHEKYGEAHAEVNAINAVQNSSLLSQSAVYVTLEPCSHHGKSPPCADLLIDVGVKKVMIAVEDPFEKVNGKGIQKLKDAGIETTIGMLENEAREINKRFLTFHRKKRPYVILKWAQTSDGFIARENGDSHWISNENSRQLVHKWRTEEDAILVGKNTALHDNPHLTAREWKGRNPTRILLDRNLEVDKEANLFNGEAQTLILNIIKNERYENNRFVRIKDMSVKSILDQLFKLNMQSVIIEGGAQTLNSFIENNCWDEARIFTTAVKFDKGIEAPNIDGFKTNEETIFGDTLTIYRNG